MRILVVLAPAESGGLEKVAELLAVGLARRGHELHFLVITDSEGSVPEFFAALESAGVEATRVVLSGRAYVAEWRAVQNACRWFRPDVVHTHGYRCDAVAGMAAVRVGMRVVSTAHGYSGEGLRNRLYQRVQELALRRFDAVAAVSTPIMQRLARSGVSKARIHTIRNAYHSDPQIHGREDARNLLRIGDGEFVVGWIGRLAHEKGPEVMLAAASHLKEPQTTVSMIGDGPLAAALQATPVSSGSRVRFHGRVHNAGSLMRAFDVFALTSHTEGTPVVLLEAMAARVPIVATTVGGVPDVLAEDEGLLVRDNDAIGIATAIERIRLDPVLRDNMVRAAHAKLHADFGFDRWIARYEELFDLVMRGPRR